MSARRLLPALLLAICAELGTASRALFLTSRPLAGRRSSRQHLTTRWTKLRERGGPMIVDESERALTTLKLGAWNRTISTGLLNRAMDMSLGTRLPGESLGEELADGVSQDLTPHGHLLSPFHPVFGRWELAFVSFKKLPPFYVPVPNKITLSRDGPGRILAHATAFDASQVGLPLGAFTVTENSTRAGKPNDIEGDGVLYGMQLSSIKPGKKVFDLVLYKEADDDMPVLAVRSTDGEEAWLLISIESRMRRRDDNVRKYAREILNLERAREPGVRDTAGGYKVMREVWLKVFKQIDGAMGTSLSSNPLLLGVSPFLPILFLGLFMFVTSLHGFGQMAFLHH